MIAQAVAFARPEQMTAIGVVAHPVTPKSFTVCINQGRVFRGKEFTVSEEGSQPRFGEEVELVIDSSSLRVLSWRDYPAEE